MRAPARAIPSCWPRPAPASINSTATNIAARFSKASSHNWSHNWSPDINMAQKLKTDWTLFGTTIGMVAFGAVILYSASSVVAELKFGSSWHFVLRQGLWLVVSLILMMYLKRTHYR